MQIDQRLHFVSDQDGGVILDAQSGVMTTLNATGAYVWRGLARGASIGTISRELIQNYGTDAGTATEDVRAFMEELREAHLLPCMEGCHDVQA